jgi:hypothetical protein
MNNTVDELMQAWRAIGGGVLELLEALKTDSGREMAHAYGVTDDDIAELQGLSQVADDFIARTARRAEAEQPVESGRAWARRWARKLAELEMHAPGRVGEHQEGELGGTTGPSNSARFPNALRAFQMEVGGTVGEFDALTPTQLVTVGVPEAELAEELARAAWLEVGSLPGSFDELTAEEQAKLRMAFSGRGV